MFRHDPFETLDLRLDSSCALEIEILRSGVAAADELSTYGGYGRRCPIEYGRDRFNKGQACVWVDAADAGHVLLGLMQEFTCIRQRHHSMERRSGQADLAATQIWAEVAHAG